MATCRYAESGFFIGPDRITSPCCGINRGQHTSTFTSIDQFNTDPNIVEIRKLSSEDRVFDHPACSKECLRREERNLPSMRMRGDKLISSGSTGRVKRLDISFGNTCNLDCVMCRPEFSSKWNVTLGSMPDDLRTEVDKNIIPNTVMSYEQIDEILHKQGSTLESVVIKGGEPLYDKRARYFIEKLSDINTDVNLNVTSNCTIINYDFLNKFKHVSITASIDGIFNMYEYIRGIDFNIVDKNIKELGKMDNINLGMQFTASKFNFHKVKDTLDYFINAGDITRFQVDMAGEPWITPCLWGEERFYEICSTTEYTANWKYKQPLVNGSTENAIKLHERYKEFWNKQRGMKWEDL